MSNTSDTPKPRLASLASLDPSACRVGPRRVGALPGLAMALLSLTLLAPAALAAQQERIDSPYRWREKGFRIGLFGGYHAANRGTLDFGQGPSAVAGAGLRLRISSPLSFDFGAAYAPAERWVVDPRPETGPAIVDTVSAGWLRIDLGVQVAFTGARTWHGIQPYGLFGAGFVFGIDEGASETFADPALAPFRYDISTAPQLHVGLGFEIFPAENLGISFEVKDYLIRLSAPSGFLLSDILQTIDELGLEAPNPTAWNHNPEFAVAFWFYP